MILDLFGRQDVIVLRQISKGVTSVVLVQPVVLLELRHYEDDVVDVALELAL